MRLRLTKTFFLLFARCRGGAYGQSGLTGLFSAWQHFLVYTIYISVMKILHTSFYLPFLSPFLSLLLLFFSLSLSLSFLVAVNKQLSISIDFRSAAVKVHHSAVCWEPQRTLLPSISPFWARVYIYVFFFAGSTGTKLPTDDTVWQTAGGGGGGLVLFQETKVEGMGDISSFPSGLF